jgi:hypothetical protein
MKLKLVLTAIVGFVGSAAPCQASWLSDNLRKAGNWPGNQIFGDTPDNANAAANAAKIAATEAAAVAAETQVALKTIAPKVDAALDLFNSSWGYVAGSFVAVMSMVFLLLAMKVIVAWKAARGKMPPSSSKGSEGPIGYPMTA